MHAIPQLVSAPLNPIPIAEHFRRSHPPCEHSRGQHIQVDRLPSSPTPHQAEVNRMLGPVKILFSTQPSQKNLIFHLIHNI